MEKIGVGIVTCGREDQFTKLFESLIPCKEKIHALGIVEDTRKELNENYDNYIDGVTKGRWKNDQTLNKIICSYNHGVAKAKNLALQWLVESDCDHFFLIEDDIFIKDPNVFDVYINTSKISGIQHFNYSQHGLMNKTFDGNSTPNPRTILDYDGNVKVPLYPHCVGAFSYYSKQALAEVGFMDENYFNACEHVDHTLEIIKAGMHPPFWTFADVDESWKYLGDEEWSLSQSTISSNDNHKKIVQAADAVFFAKHGCYPAQIPLTSIDNVVESIKSIKRKYGK